MRNEDQDHAGSHEGVWIRGLFMLLFMIVHRLASIVLGFLVFVQFIFTVIKDRQNERLSRFTVALNKYIYQAGIYATYETEERPYPFKNWPDDGATDQVFAAESDVSASAAPTPEAAATKRKPAPKKRAPAKPRAPKADPKDTE